MPVRVAGVVEVVARAHAPRRLQVFASQAPLLAGVGLRAAGGAVRDRELRAPRAGLEAELHAIVRRVEADARHLADERRVVLEPQPERQVHLPGLHVVALRFVEEESPVGLEVPAVARRELLVDVHRQPVGNDVDVEVGAQLVDGEGEILVLRVREIRVRRAAAEVAAERDEPVQLAEPLRIARLDAPRRQLVLRECVAGRVAQAPARRVDVAARALQSLAHREIRLRGGGHVHGQQADGRRNLEQAQACAAEAHQR